jgi:hypothetical protein
MDDDEPAAGVGESSGAYARRGLPRGEGELSVRGEGRVCGVGVGGSWLTGLASWASDLSTDQMTSRFTACSTCFHSPSTPRYVIAASVMLMSLHQCAC